MKFPAANVSIRNWDKDEDYLVYILENEFIYTTDNKLYQKYFKDNLFVDSNGEIHRLTDRKLPSSTRRFFSFIPNFCKVELLFRPTEGRMTIEEVRQHILAQLYILDNDKNKTEWIEKVKNAKIIEEIIFG